MLRGRTRGAIRRRVFAGVLLGMFVLGGVQASPASAGLLSTLTSIIGGVTSTLGLGPTEQRVDNVLQGTLSGVTGLVCQVGNQLPPPVGTGLCLVGIVQMDIHTVYRAPDGHEVVRDTLALPLVPTLVDVTGDGLPDVLSLVTLTSFNRFTLVVTKLPTTLGPLPVQFELVIRNPGAPGTASRIAVGFDARQSFMPTRFTASASLLAFDPLHLGVTVDQLAPPPKMALIASIFDLAMNGTRTENFHVRLDQAPVPTSAGYDLLLGTTHKHVTLTSNVRSVAGLDLLFVANGHVQTIKGTINSLPSKVDLDIADTDVNHRTFTYDAAQSIADANLTYLDLLGGAIATEIVAHVVDLPTGATFSQTGPLAYTLSTRGGAIGMVEGGFASGQHVVPMFPNESGGDVRVNGTKLSIGARLRGLTSFTGDFSNPYTADVMAAAQPMHVVFDDAVSGMHIDAHVLNLPKHIYIKADPDHGHVEENGFGDTIASVDAVATKPSGLFASPLTGTPIRRLSAVVLGVPSSFKLDYVFGTGGVFKVSMDNPATEVRFSGDDGAHLPALPAGAGIIYHDTTAALYGAGRVFGLKKVLYEPNPIAVTVESAGSQDFSIDALVKLPATILHGTVVKATGRIANLPRSVVVKVATTATGADVDYTASDPIDELTLAANAGTGFFTAPLGGKPVFNIGATLKGIPAAFKFHFDTAAGAFKMTLDHPVSQIDITADDGFPTAAMPTDAGVDYTDVASHFSAAARVYGLTKVSYEPKPVTLSYAGAPNHGFSFKGDVLLPQGTYPCLSRACEVVASGGILRMPGSIDITALSTDHTDAGGNAVKGMKVTYTASSAISTLLVDAAAGQPFFTAPLNGGKVTHLHAQISSLPAAFTVNFESGGGAFLVTMDNPAGQIDVIADDGNTTVQVPGGGGVDYTDTGSNFAAAARVFGITKLSYLPNPTTLEYAGAAGHTFSLNGVVELPSGTYPCNASACRVTAMGNIDKMPATLKVVAEKSSTTDAAGVTTNGQRITYTASDPISSIWVDATATQPFFSSPLTNSSIKHLHAQLSGIPATFVANVAFGGGAFKVSLDNTVDLLQVEADDGLTGHDLGVRADPGVTYNDVAGNFTAQLTIQKPLGFSFSPPLSVSYTGGAAQKFDFAAKVDIAAAQGLCTDSANAATACTIRASGTIDKLPASMALSTVAMIGANGYILNVSSDGILHACPVPLTNGSCRGSGQVISYTASDPIDALSFQATVDTPGAALLYSPMTQSPVKHLQAALTTIPASFKFTIRNGSATATGPRMGFVGQMNQGSLGKVQLAADDGVSGHDPGLRADPGATYVDVAGNFAAAATLDGFSEINVSGNPFGLVLKSGGATTFPVTAQVALPNGTSGICPGTSACVINASAQISPLPGTLTVDNTTDSAGNTRFDYSASSTIDTLRMTATSDTANLLPADKTCFDNPVPASTCVPIRKVFAQVRGLPSKLHATIGANASQPDISFSAEGGAIGDVWFEALDSSTADLIGIPTVTGGLKDKSAVGGGASALDNDGFVIRDFRSAGKLTIAARLAGLQSVSFSSKPTSIFRFPNSTVLSGSIGISPDFDSVLNIDPTRKPFAIDMRSGSESDPSYMWGGLSNIPSTVSFSVTSGKTVVTNPNPPPSGKPKFDITQLYDKIAYSAQDTIDEISLVTNLGDLPLATVNLLNLPKTLNICLATSVYGDTIERSKCLPPRPAGYPADNIPNATDPFLMGTGNGNNSDGFHQAIVDIDGSSEFTIKALVCVIAGSGCPVPSNLSDSFSHANSEWIIVNNLYVKKLMLDALAETSNGGGVISGHIGLDTQNNNAHGQLAFNDGSADMYGGQVYALVTLTDGFKANYLYTGWRNQPFTLTKINVPGTNQLYNHNGTISCPAGTHFIGGFAPFVGGISFAADLTGRESIYRADEDYLGCGP